MIAGEIKWDPNATPPQFTDNEEIVIEPGTHIRIKIIGLRTEVGEMWAIGSIKEDFLGYATFLYCLMPVPVMLTHISSDPSCLDRPLSKSILQAGVTGRLAS